MNIPAPSQQYDSYDYNYTSGRLRENFANEASYGGGVGGEQDPSMDAYKQQLSQYIQQAQIELSRLQQGTPEYEQDLAYYQQALEYAQQVGLQVQPMQGMGNEFDPLSNRGAAGYGANPSYQDSSKIVYEDALPAMTADRKDLREEHFYSPPYDFTVPGAATAVASNEVDPNHPDKTRVCVAVTWPDGTVKKHYFYNVDWKENGLTLQSTSPENQITLDPSLAGNTHVTTAEIGGSNSTSQAGDPPTKMDGDKRVYDGQSFDISPVAEGSNKETKVMASGDVMITPNSNEEYYVVDYQGGKYIVKVYANDEDFKSHKIKETISINGSLVDSIYFAADRSRVALAPSLRDHNDIHSLNDSDEAKKITLDSETDDVAGSDQNAGEIFDNFKATLGSNKSDAQILSALKQAGLLSPSDTLETLKQKMGATPPSFPPTFSNQAGSDFQKLINAIVILDDQISNKLNVIRANPSDPNINSLLQQATGRLKTDLQALYPEHNISMPFEAASAGTTDRYILNNLNFDGTEFSWTKNTWYEVEVTPIGIVNGKTYR